jgi:hypothetical protein
MKLTAVFTLASLALYAGAAPAPEGGVIVKRQCGYPATVDWPSGPETCCDCYTCNDDPYVCGYYLDCWDLGTTGDCA